MNIWSNVVSFFTSNKVADNILDKDNGLLTQIGGWVGNANFTEEEGRELNQKLSNAVADFAVKTMDENTERSKTRRNIAIMWIKAQLALVFLVVVVAPFDIELAKFYATIAFGTLMLGGTLSVLAFFFGGHMLSAHLGMGRKNK